jgi:hypothetical protein
MVEHHSPFRLTAIRVGFIGTSEELHVNQLIRIRALLVGFAAAEIHHGGRMGSDVQVHDLSDELGLWRFVHPDDEVAYRAHFRSDAIYPAVPYEESQTRIVDASEALIAVPAADERPENGKTWAIVHRAVATGKPVVVVGPDGEVLWASPIVFGSAAPGGPW